MNLRTLTDDELLRHAHIELDPLTSTDLEAELLRRFEENAAVTAENEPLLKLLADRDIETADELKKTLDDAEWFAQLPTAKALAEVLSEFDIDDPDVLKRILERNQKFEDLKNDLAEPLASLQTLITQEA